MQKTSPQSKNLVPKQKAIFYENKSLEESKSTEMSDRLGPWASIQKEWLYVYDPQNRAR